MTSSSSSKPPAQSSALPGRRPARAWSIHLCGCRRRRRRAAAVAGPPGGRLREHGGASGVVPRLSDPDGRVVTIERSTRPPTHGSKPGRRDIAAAADAARRPARKLPAPASDWSPRPALPTVQRPVPAAWSSQTPPAVDRSCRSRPSRPLPTSLGGRPGGKELPADGEGHRPGRRGVRGPGARG